MNKIITILFLITSLYSCRSIDPQWRYTASFTFNSCKRVLMNMKTLKPMSEVEDLPMEECDDVTGFKFQQYIKVIKPWIKESKRYCEDLKK